MSLAQHLSPEHVLQRQADIATLQGQFLEKHGASREKEPDISTHLAPLAIILHQGKGLRQGLSFKN
jgi:hypothetical protein